MKKLKRFISRHLNKFLHRFGFEIKKKCREDLHFYAQYPQESLVNKRFYNVGGRNFTHLYWTNLDHTSGYYQENSTGTIEYDLNALEALPIEDNTAEIIYSSHTIEHVPDESVRHFVKEAFRALKKGGGIRIAAPDMELAYNAYQNNDRLFMAPNWENHPDTWSDIYTIHPMNASIEQLFLFGFATQLSEIRKKGAPTKQYSDCEIRDVFKNKSFEQAMDFFCQYCQYDEDQAGFHMSWWSYDKLFKMLRESGFQDVYRSAYSQSRFPPMRNTFLFDSSAITTALYVEAIK